MSVNDLKANMAIFEYSLFFLQLIDLLPINEKTVNFHQLYLPVKQLLKTTNTMRSFMNASDSSLPVVVHMDSTLEECISLIEEHHVHRLFIADTSLKLEGEISLCDIIAQFKKNLWQ